VWFREGVAPPVGGDFGVFIFIPGKFFEFLAHFAGFYSIFYLSNVKIYQKFYSVFNLNPSKLYCIWKCHLGKSCLSKLDHTNIPLRAGTWTQTRGSRPVENYFLFVFRDRAPGNKRFLSIFQCKFSVLNKF